MSTTTEETKVTTEPTGADAFTAARAAVGKGDETPATDDTSTPTPPAEDTAKVADQTTETTDPDTLLTEEELAALPPKERAKAEKWQAKLTQKAQKLSATEKELEQWKTLNEGIRSKSREALDIIANHYGVSIAEAKAIQDNTSEHPELDPLDQYVETKLAPVKQAIAEWKEQATAAETEATMKQFSADHPGWEKHEAKMLEIGKTILPGKGVTDYDYLKTLHKLATSDINEAEKTKKVVAKINAAAKVSEEKTSGIPNERVSMKIPDNFAQLDSKERMRLSYEAAKRGEVWEK